MTAWDARIDASSPDIEGGAAIMYSGGADSTLAACRLAMRFPKVHLVTYMRFGFLQFDNPDVHFQRMQARFPDVTFTLNKIPQGNFYEEVEGHKRFRNLLKHGAMTSVPCGSCKLSMHWRTLLYCLENGIRYAADGAVHGNEQFAEQNENVMMKPLIDFYGEHGITLVHPVWEHGLDTEAALYDLGITDTPRIKRTRKDKQVICTQHILFAAFMRKYLAKHSFEEYEAETTEYLNGKLDHMRSLTDEWVNNRSGRIKKLLDVS